MILRPLKHVLIRNQPDAERLVTAPVLLTTYYLHERANTWKRWLSDAAERGVDEKTIDDHMYKFWMILPPTSQWFRQYELTGFETIDGRIEYTGGTWGKYIEGFAGSYQEFIDACTRHLEKYIFTEAGWHNYSLLEPGKDYSANDRS